MQLKLLKMESGTYTETSSSLLPIEEEEVQLSPVASEVDHIFAGESWRTCYALDVLIESGLEESDFNTLRKSWHSPNCPLDPKVFDKLEKRYNDETKGSRWERRLLFDRINSTVLEILEERVNLCPWVMPKVAGWNSQWRGVEEALERLINEDYANGERELDREMLWSDSIAEIDVLGSEIEKMLIDDLIIEVVCN